MEESQQKYRKTPNCVYNLNYHIVWTPQRRKPVLVGAIAEDFKILVSEKAKALGISIESMEVMPDHVHLFISAPPKFSPHKIIKLFKGATGRFLRQKFPQLLKLPSMWSGSYYIGSVGFVSESVVRNYIENQKGK